MNTITIDGTVYMVPDGAVEQRKLLRGRKAEVIRAVVHFQKLRVIPAMIFDIASHTLIPNQNQVVFSLAGVEYIFYEEGLDPTEYLVMVGDDLYEVIDDFDFEVHFKNFGLKRCVIKPAECVQLECV